MKPINWEAELHKLHNYFSYQVMQVQLLAEHVSQILLSPEEHALTYQAGQYVFVLQHDQTESPLSIACAPRADGVLEFHLLHAPGNPRAQELLHAAEKNKVWHLRGPEGVCTLAHLHADKPVIFLAYGTGFAPVKALLESPAFSLPAFLYWYMPRQSDFYLLDRWGDKLSYDLFSHHEDMLHAMLRMHPDLSDKQVYAVGSPRVVKGIFEACQERGLRREFFYSDVF